MKVKHIVASLSLAMVTAFGLAAGLSAKQEAKAVKADAPESDVVMYVDFSNVSGWWFSASAVTKIEASGSAVSTVDIDVTYCESQLYKFTLEAGYSSFFVKRLNPENLSETWNSTHAVYYSESFNLVNIKDTKNDGVHNDYSVSTLVRFVNDYLVVDAYQSSSYWGNDSAHIYVCYYYGDAAWGFSEFQAPNAPIGSTNLYSIRLSFYADRFVIVRGTSDFAGFVEGWESKVWNKSTDITIAASNKNCKYVKLGTSIPDSKDVNVAGFEEISAASFVDSYSYQFLQFGLCLDAGGLNENFATNFATAQQAFNDMNSYANYHGVNLKSALQAVNNSEDSNAGHAMKRYDTIMAKNPSVASDSNFLERSIDPSLAIGHISIDSVFGNNSLSVIIIAIVSLSALAATLFFVFKKKKQN